MSEEVDNVTHPLRVAIWDSINLFADAGRGVYGNVSRQKAAVEVERAIDALIAAVRKERRTAPETARGECVTCGWAPCMCDQQ